MKIKDIFRDCRAATAIEYGLIAGLIAVAMIAGLRSLGNATGGLWNNISNSAGDAMSNALRDS